METTNLTVEERTDDTTDCDNDWCDGPASDTLPCFACFDPEREYEGEGDTSDGARGDAD